MKSLTPTAVVVCLLFAWVAALLLSSTPGLAALVQDRPPAPAPQRYLCQSPPGAQPALFAPGVVSVDEYQHSSISVTPNSR